VQQALDGQTLTLPAGFAIAVYAEQLPGVRLMALGPEGDVYATLTEAGRVVRLRDSDHNGGADSVAVVADGLNLPHGLAFRGDTLYVAENHRVVRFDRPGVNPTVVVANLPDPPLVGLVPDLAAAARPGGTLIVTGVRLWQAEAVSRSLARAGTAPSSVQAEGGWATFVVDC